MHARAHIARSVSLVADKAAIGLLCREFAFRANYWTLYAGKSMSHLEARSGMPPIVVTAPRAISSATISVPTLFRQTSGRRNGTLLTSPLDQVRIALPDTNFGEMPAPGG